MWNNAETAMWSIWDFDNQAHDPFWKSFRHQQTVETMKTSASITAPTFTPLHNYRDTMILGCTYTWGDFLKRGIYTHK